MSWKGKFKEFVEGVLNEYSETGPWYKVEVVDDHNVKVTHAEEPELKNWSKEDLPSHWREIGTRLIKHIIDRRINNYLK